MDIHEPSASTSASRRWSLSRLPAGRTLAAVGSGILMAAAYPPFEVSQLAWVALVPLLIAMMGVAPREGARLGWITGLTFWLTGLSWLLRLFETSPAPFPLILLGWAVLSVYCAAYVAVFAYTFAWLAGRIGTARLWQTLLLMALATATWVGGEYARGAIGGGFPWNDLGISQFRNLGLIQAAAWGGVAAVSAVIMLMNVGIAFTIRRYLPGPDRQKYRPHVELFVGLLAIVLCYRFGFAAVRGHGALPPSVTIAAVQPAIPQIKKWETGDAERILTRLRQLTDSAATAEPRPDLIVWPETATPDCATTENESLGLIRDMGRHGIPLLVGTMDVTDAGKGEFLCYNASLLFTPEGTIAARYDKQHLVPFGEYIPFSEAIPWLARLAPMGWNCTAGRAATVMEAGDPPVPFSCLICFEDIMPGLARRAVLNGARLLINQTNDAWFDRSAGPVQHLSHSVFRAIENRVPVIRVANSGITCLVHPTGAIDSPTSNAPGVPPAAAIPSWDVGIPGPEWTPTPYARHGDLSFALPCACLALAGFVLALWASRRKIVTRDGNGVRA